MNIEVVYPPDRTPPEAIALTYDPLKRKFIMLFDASAYARADCHKNMFFLIVKGLNSGKKDHKMEYGTAFHAALAHYYTHRRHSQTSAEIKALQAQSLGKAVAHFMQPDIEIPEDDYRTISHLVGCLGQYFNRYETDPIEALRLRLPDGTEQALVEQKFAIPFYSDGLLEVMLSGTVDLVAYYFDQLIFIDHKSTSATWVKGYLAEYDLSAQLMMYAMILKKLFPALIDSYYGIGAMINGIFLRKSGTNDFQRSDVQHFTPEQITAFEEHLTETVMRIAAAFHAWFFNGTPFKQNFTQCNTKFGCPYKRLCKAGELDRARMIEEDYVLRAYDPRAFQTAGGEVTT